MYVRAQEATLTIEAMDGRGNRLAIGSGFLLDEGLVVTAFQVIEGAARVRVARFGQVPVETDELTVWNRRQDWAVLRSPPLAAAPPPLDRTRSWKVGDRCSFLDTTPDGARVMVDTNLIGVQEFPQAGARLSINSPVSARSVGAPLLNEYGQAIAVLGGTLTPGHTLAGRRPGAFLQFGNVTTMGVPLASVPVTTPASATHLADLAARGVFVPPLVGPVNVLTGNIAHKVEMRHNIPFAVGEGFEFSRRDQDAVAYLTFDPQEKREGMSVYRIYDLDNRLMIQGRPVKLVLRPRVYSVNTWPFPLGPLPSGVYRIDLVMDADPVWRSYFRVVD
jgi:hypothetical protein